MTQLLETYFPGLAGSRYEITSPATPRYNCVAWAVGEQNRFWWPAHRFHYWPPEAPDENSVAAFRTMLELRGYTECQSPVHQEGVEKVALFAQDGDPKHLARQLPDGSWTSKLGPNVDIKHNLHDLEGAEYGQVALVMERDREAER